MTRFTIDFYLQYISIGFIEVYGSAKDTFRKYLKSISPPYCNFPTVKMLVICPKFRYFLNVFNRGCIGGRIAQWYGTGLWAG
jgi:hypothetical protein